MMIVILIMILMMIMILMITKEGKDKVLLNDNSDIMMMIMIMKITYHLRFLVLLEHKCKKASTCLSYHFLPPSSPGLFHGAVLMSGSAKCSWAVQEKPRAHAHRFARELGCPDASVAELRACLLSKRTEEVVEAQARMHVRGLCF